MRNPSCVHRIRSRRRWRVRVPLVLIVPLLTILGATIGSPAGPKRVGLYAIDSYTIDGIPAWNSSPYFFLELFGNRRFVLLGGAGVEGAYGFVKDVLRLAFPNGTVLAGRVTGDLRAGSVQFDFSDQSHKRNLVMCIASAIDFPPRERYCR